MQRLSLGIAGKLPEKVLVTRRLPIAIVLAIEARTRQRYLAGFRMPGLAAAQLRPQGINQAAGAQQAGIGVIALRAVELEAEFTGEIQPHWHFLLFARPGVTRGQPLQHLPVDQLAEEVGLDGFGDRLEVIDLAPAEGLLQPVDGGQEAFMKPDQGGAGLAELAIVLGQAAQVVQILGRE